ncbi:uncharacterized protein LOC108161520 [Drosophila miranda]|uniref:uncharacterized protein LOC108161520 n=1 Tax=Drosophila miranda TaxID=7229 RepID=UPI0007E85D43|nr:uncharacterized protein LOC108161520 [Drosophila miranda]
MDSGFTTSHTESDVYENKYSRDEENMEKFYATVGNISRNMRKGDWTYLQRHPEIRAIIRTIITEAIEKKPSNIFQFAANLFQCNNELELVRKINKQLKLVNQQLRGGNWGPADGEMLFTESSDVFTELKAECKSNFLNQTVEPQMKETRDPVGPENFKPSCPENPETEC